MDILCGILALRIEGKISEAECVQMIGQQAVKCELALPDVIALIEHTALPSHMNKQLLIDDVRQFVEYSYKNRISN